MRDEGSLRSVAAGYSLTALPASGYDGPVPVFPLPPRQVFVWEVEGKHRVRVCDPVASAEVYRFAF